jgi:hypothetical protein
MKKALIITLGVIVLIVLLGALVFGGVYNNLVTKEEGVTRHCQVKVTEFC